LYLGDCLALLDAGMIQPDASIIADPPYGIGFRNAVGGLDREVLKGARLNEPIYGDREEFNPEIWVNFASAGAKVRGSPECPGALRLALFGADNYARRLPMAKGAWYVWDKSVGGGPNDSFIDAEFIWMGTRSARRIFRHKWKGRTRDREGQDANLRFHVAEKPVSLMAWVIETVRTPVGSLVCDPYMGSGTTGVACIRTGRRFLGIEIDPAHYAIACARIEKAWAQAQGAA
jgi:hypothetical protein